MKKTKRRKRTKVILRGKKWKNYLNRTARITVLSFSGSRPVKELKFRFYTLKYVGFKSWREKEAPQKLKLHLFHTRDS